jgi:carboxyl-terminal processing protease
MNTFFPKSIVALLLISYILISCQKDDPGTESVTYEVNKFIYKGLYTYYLWNDKVPTLKDPQYEKQSNFNDLLNSYSDPEGFFNSLLYQKGTVDRWSFIVDDVKEINNWIAGISESVGVDFRLYYIDDSKTKLVGIIRYVLKNTPASKAGLKRGDMFLTINGEQLTSSNYETLLFTNKTSTVGLASYNGSGFVLNNKSVTLTAVVIQENPIFLDTILNVNNLKVGYLVYNAFNSSYDSLNHTTYDLELNQVFGKLKTGGVQKLIIDLRYNGGGTVTSAIYLASMIYSTDPQKVFCKTMFNDYLQTYYEKTYGKEALNYNFVSEIAKTSQTSAQTVNSLGLNEVYIIGSSETASASELVINGLKPYITVKLVGTNTYGKYVGSMTIQDADEDGIINPHHTWAMQPIVLKTSNSAGESDYVNGLTPTITAKESAVELVPFCDPNEPLLRACLNDIKGIKSAPVKTSVDFTGFKSSDDFAPMAKTMVVRDFPGRQLR